MKRRYVHLRDRGTRVLCSFKPGCFAHRVMCCDCSLVHDIVYEVNAARTWLTFTAGRNERATAAARRGLR